MTSLKQRKTIVLALALIIVTVTGIIGLGIPRVHALGSSTGGIAISALNCGSPGATCPTGLNTQTDTTIAGTPFPVKNDFAIKFVNTTNTQAEKWAAPKAIVRDANGNGIFDTGEAVLYGTAPTVGTKLSCAVTVKSCVSTTAAGSRDNTIQRFIGAGASWVSGNTAFQDSNLNTLYDWGEFVYAGAVPSSTATVAKTFVIGLLMNATASGPINGVYGWQVVVNYDPNYITPSANPNPGASYPDAGFNVVNFGSVGAANWAGLIGANQAFGGSIVAENRAIHEGNITVFFTMLSPNPAQSVLAKNLLATVSFGLVAKPPGPLSLTLSGINFVDSSTNTIPGPFAEQGATINITNNPPTATFTTTKLTDYSYSFDGSLSSDPEDGILSLGSNFFWDFGDGTRDLGVTGPFVSVDYSVDCAPLCPDGKHLNPGIFNVTLRVVDSLGATGAARDPLGVAIGNPQPSHAFQSVVSNAAPVSSFTFTPASPVPNPTTVKFDGSGSTDDGTPLGSNSSAQIITGITKMIWKFGDGSPIVQNCIGALGCSNSTKAVHTYNTNSPPAGYNATLTVVDAFGANNTSVQSIVVGVTNNPVVTASCSAATAGKPITCTATGSAGAPPYTFTWTATGGSPATGTGTSFTTTFATKGSFTVGVTITDSASHTGSSSVPVTVTPQPLVVTVTCPTSGVTVGKSFNCTVAASGGTGPYTGTGTFSKTETTKGSKTESFTVTDANAISASGSATVSVAAQPLVVTVTCPTTGVTIGKPFNCTVAASGGTGPYTGTGTFSRTETTKGTKTESFTVTDANAVSASGSTTVSVAAQTLVVTVTCPTSGVTIGKPFNCTVTASGGSAPYTGTGTLSRTETTKGTKTESFTVTDANAVSASGSATVSVAAQTLVVTVSCPTSGVTAGKPFNCTVSASGGSAPYTGTGTISRTEPAKGSKTESFTVTDSNAVSASGSATVSVAAQAIVVTVTCPTSGVTAGKPFNCTVSATGGTAPYTGTGTLSRTEPTKGTKTESFTVTDTNAVSASGSATVSVAAQALVVTVSCPTSGVTAGKPFNCTVSATGGTAPYTGTGTISRTEPTKGSKTESFTVTDTNAVSASGSATVSVAAQALVVTVTCPTSGVTAGKPFSCTVSATGGTAPYTGTGSISRTEPTKGSKTESFTVTDTNAVSASGSATVSVAAQALVVTVTCPTSGVTAGKPFSCTVSATGGTAPYTGTGSISRTEPTKGSKTESFTVTDTNAVSASGSATVSVAAQALVVTVTCPPSGVTAGKPFNCTVSATGGTTPYTGTGTISRTEPTKGSKTESFTVTDTNAVSASGSATVSVAAQALVVTVSCPTSGVTAGKPFNCTVTASGGSTPYTGTGTFSRTEAVKGSRTESFTVTDANTVSASGSATVSVAAQPIVASFTFTPVSPLVGQSITFTATVTGGTTPYTFKWNFGDGSPQGTTNPVSHSYAVKGAKTVTLNVTDANNQFKVSTQTVSVSGTALVVTATCPTSGVTAGKPFSCTVSATGGTAPYTGTGTISRTEPTKGTKTESFTVTDANAATATGSTTVSVAAQTLVVTVTCPTSGVTAGKPFSCTVSASGGSAPYTGTGSLSRTEPTKGSKTESFTVTDANTISASGSATVSVAAQALVVTASCPTSGVTVGKPFNCTVSATGGSTPYTGVGTISRTEPSKGLKTESFTVTDANAVSASGSTTVTVGGQPIVASFTFNPTSPSVGQSVTFTATVSGGTSPYSFKWNFGDGSVQGTTNPVSHSYTTKGTKTVTLNVTDANNQFTLTSNPVTVTGAPIVVTVTCPTSGVTIGKPFNCTVTATGGTSPYTGTGTFSKTETTKGSKTESFTVTDSNAISASGSATVSVAAQTLVVTVSCPTSGVTAGKPFNCTVSASGGSAPYTGTGTISRTEPTKGLKTESFTVTDSNAVSASGSASVNVAAQALVVTVSCPTSGVTIGKAFNCTVTAAGGTSPYTGTGTFSKTETTKGPKTESFTVTDTNAVSASGSATVSVAAQPLVVTVTCPTTGLTAGKPFNCTVTATGGSTPYTGTGTFSKTEPTKGTKTESFTVTDANAASASGSASVSIGAQPIVVTFTVSANPTVGSPVTFTDAVTGGTAPYTYSWNFGDSSTGTGNPVSHTYSTKGPKTVTVTVTDGNSATGTSSQTVNVAGTTLVVSATCPTSGVTAGKAFTCTVTASGDTGPYTGTGTISRTEPTKGSKTESFTVTDANGVSKTATATVTVGAQPLIVTVSCPTSGVTSGKPFNCTVSATGGSTPYTGTGTFSRTEPTKGSKTESFTVTDANTVSASGSATVSVAAQALVVTVSCPANATAGVAFNCTVSATGGTTPYTGTGTFSRTEPTKGSKTESFTVTDSNAVSASGSATVNVQGTALIVTVSCPTSGVTAGKPFNCTVTASGDTGPYTGTGTFSRTEPTKGTKTESFTVTDANSVSASGSATVSVAAQSLTVTVSCPTSGVTAGKPFSCTVSATGGTAPYTGTGTISRTEPTKGTKTESFTVTDTNAASASGSASVTVAAQALTVTATCPTSGLTAGKPFNCTVTATGGTAPYTGTGTISRTEPTKGTKTESFTVTDTNAVSASASFGVTIAAQPVVATVTCPTSGVTAGKPFNCTVTATGGTAPYTGTGTFSKTEPVKGTKTESFTVMDANGISASGSASVSVAAQPLVVTVTCPTSGLTAGKPFNCTVTATGGTTPYTGTGTFSRTEATKGSKTESFTVSDSNTVSASGSATVSIAAQALVVTVSCPANATVGVAFNCTVTATGGTTPYTGTGTFSRTETSKGSKTESFTVTDSNAVTASGSATVNVQGTALVVTVTCPTSGVTVGKPFNCTVTASGDTGPYTGTGTFSRTENTKGTKTETFSVTDANSVTASGSATVSVAGQPLVVTVSCPTSGVTAGKAFSCTVTATGGSSPYTGTGTFSRTEAVKGSRTESFTVTDSNAASASGSATVSVAAQPLVVTVSCPANATAGTAFNCTVSATGGTTPYTGTGTFSRTEPTKGTRTETFSVTDTNAVTASGSASVNVQGTPLVVSATCPTSGVTVGKPFNCTVTASGDTGPYTGTGTISRTENTKGTKTESFTVTDANGVTQTATSGVTVGGQPLVVTVTCPTSGVTAGKPFNCSVSASGGTAPYTGTGTLSRTEPVKGTKTESFTVTDSNAVSASGSASVTVAAQALVVTVTCPANATAGTAFNCTVTATGGTAPYTGTGTFSRTEPTKGSKTETFSVTDTNSVTASGSATVNVSGTALIVTVTCPTSGVTLGKAFNCTVTASGDTGPYTGTGTFSRTEVTKGTKTETFSVTDANGVTASGSATVTPAAQPGIVTVSCPTSGVTAGKAFNCTVSATGGTAPYTGTGTFSRTEPTKGSKTESFTVTDANGQSASGSATVSIGPQPLVVTVSCPANATAGVAFNCTVTATGGTTPYTGTGTISRTEPAKGSKTESFTVTDTNAVSASGSATVNVQGTPLVASATCPTSGVTVGKPFNCTVTASGDTGPYTGTGTVSRTENSKGTKTETFTVTDANGVTATATSGVTVAGQPLVVTATCPSSGVTAGKPFSCTVSATGGTGPYTGVGLISRTEATKGSKTETFTVTDANSVTATGSASVNVGPQPLVVTVSCPANATVGVAFNCTVTATGGTAPYTGTGSFSRTESSKGVKTETFTVTDTNAVSASGSTTVAVSGVPLAVAVSCPTTGITVGKPFNCTVSATGGTAPFTGTGTFSRTESIKGTRSELFSVTDANGATASGTATVSVGGQPIVVSVTCPVGGATAGKPFSCTVSATGGTAPYTGVGSISRTAPAKGVSSQTFTVSDTNGASASASVTVNIAPQPLVAAFTFGGNGVVNSPQTFMATATGGTAPYVFSWAFGDNSTGSGTPVTHSYSTPFVYTVFLTVTDANNATATTTHTITIVAATLTPCFTETLTTALTGVPISFDASCSSSSGTITSYSWNFGDSNTGTGKTTTHTYTTAGNYTVTLTVTDSNSLTASATSTKVISAVSGKDVLTDGNLCPLTGNQFSLIFISDKTGMYTLVASNPGQLYDNVIDNGTAGTPVTLHIQIPYPFVTQGGNPIQVSSSFTLSKGCYKPAFDQTSLFSITTAGGHLTSSSHAAIVLSDYGLTPTVGTTTTQVTVSGMIPSTGTVYVTIHLDYGLKGTTGWTKGASPFPAINSALGVTINNPQSYSFSFVDGTPGSTTPTSINIWKINSGFAGAVINGFNEQPMVGVTAKVYDQNGNLIGITTTDQNGVYSLFYKYTGNKVNYQVKVIKSATLYGSATVSMQANKVVQTNFALSLSGDVNGDCTVNILDLTQVGAAYGARSGQSKWNQNADLNNDGSIDIVDLATVAKSLSLSC